ncbi:PC4 and SFRS1-interacting protein [Homalodisca vitripennis]|nr:PC4 and SFRS1-interacting protein [Homalodisca vitripennis]
MAVKFKFNKGDKVFAKIRGFPYWPATVDSVLSTEKQQAKYVIFFGTKETATINDEDACLYAEYKHIHGRPKTDNVRNKKFNQALKEAETSETTEADFKFKKSDTLNMLVKNLEESLAEENLLENLENDEDKLKLAAKIGTTLLEENKLLKRQNFELESKLTAAEEKAEGLEREGEICTLKIEESYTRWEKYIIILKGKKDTHRNAADL